MVPMWRVGGTTRQADRPMIQTMYYEGEGRSYDRVIRREMTVSDEEISALCTAMKQVALRNCKDDVQRQNVKNVTKNVLLNWAFWKRMKMARFVRRMPMCFCLERMCFVRTSSVACQRDDACRVCR